MACILLWLQSLTTEARHGPLHCSGTPTSLGHAVGWVLLRVLAILIGLELVYIVGANAVLSTTLTRSAVESARGIKLDYGSAYSVMPGRIHVRGVRLRFEDRNVQFQLTIGSGRFDVNLHELANRTFHVRSVRAADVTYRMRDKVHEVGGDEARLAAYAPIEGFTDPPLYKAEPPITPTPVDKLWRVHIENVIAEVNELWILEYRFSGAAEASGSFILQPTQWVQVSPGQLRFRYGGLYAGPHAVAKDFRGTIQCTVPGLDVRKATGMEVFRGISAKSEMQLSQGQLGFLDLYTVPRTGVSIAGEMSVGIRADLEQGRVGSNTVIDLQTDSFVSRLGNLEATGRLKAAISRDTGAERMRVNVDIANTSLRTKSSQSSGPILRRSSATLLLDGVDLLQGVRPADAELDADVEFPQFRWFNDVIASDQAPLFHGRGNAQFGFKRTADGTGSGQLEVALERAGLTYRGKRVSVEGHATARFRTEERPQRSAQGALSAQLSGAESWLALALGPFLQNALAHGLDLGAVDATVAFHVAPKQTTLELTHAHSGKLEAKGFLRLPTGREKVGAVLFSAGPWRLGLALEGGETRFTPLVSGQWLDDRASTN
ncbi:MAG TPA: hypothetical protein VKP30_20265 [Polyangiaceae bacterium]|nr:hypothetical protein [Polyangiaceae bacterium]